MATTPESQPHGLSVPPARPATRRTALTTNFADQESAGRQQYRWRWRGGTVFLKTITALGATAMPPIPTTASANLGAAGPVDPASVPFPTFYDDGAATSLALCVNDPLCPASPPVFTNEAPNDEAFYMAASAELSGPRGQSIGMEFAIEAAW